MCAYSMPRTDAGMKRCVCGILARYSPPYLPTHRRCHLSSIPPAPPHQETWRRRCPHPRQGSTTGGPLRPHYHGNRSVRRWCPCCHGARGCSTFPRCSTQPSEGAALNPPPESIGHDLEERCSGTGTAPHHPPPSSPAKTHGGNNVVAGLDSWRQ